MYFLVFLLGITLRGIPELLVSWYPIGYETITYYAPPMFAFAEQGLVDVFVGFFRAGPLFYVLMWFAKVASGAHPYLILKFVGPLLYGGLAVSFLLFLRRGLKLDEKMALLGAVLLVFQVATLRESWDRFRNVLALIFVFATLTALKSDHKYKWWLVSIFAVLTALSREYIAFVLFVSVLGFAVLQRKDRLVSLVALAPALATFCIMNFPRQLWWSYIPNSQYAWSSYLWTVQEAFIIFAVCFLPLLPFVVKGFRRDKLLEPMFGLLLLGSFSVIVSPWFAVLGYQRWLILLVFPFTIYAIRGFDRLRLFDRSSFRKLVAILCVFMVFGVGYSSGAFSYVMLPNSWVPTNLVQSSIGWNQIDDVKDVLRWLDENAEANSSILSEERFYGWTLIYLKRANNDVEVIPYGANSPPEPALEKALSDGFSWIYLIWYTDSNLENFKPLYSQNSVSIFRYEPQVASF
jgi:hypothetical protein